MEEIKTYLEMARGTGDIELKLVEDEWFIVPNDKDKKQAKLSSLSTVKGKGKDATVVLFAHEYEGLMGNEPSLDERKLFISNDQAKNNIAKRDYDYIKIKKVTIPIKDLKVNKTFSRNAIAFSVKKGYFDK